MHALNQHGSATYLHVGRLDVPEQAGSGMRNGCNHFNGAQQSHFTRVPEMPRDHVESTSYSRSHYDLLGQPVARQPQASIALVICHLLLIVAALQFKSNRPCTGRPALSPLSPLLSLLLVASLHAQSACRTKGKQVPMPLRGDPSRALLELFHLVPNCILERSPS